MYEYHDGLCPGGRRPRLYLAHQGKAVKFTGQNIPGVVAIAASSYSKAGKWSSTSYQLEFGVGVRPLYFISPLHGTWGDKFESWGEVIAELSLPIEITKEIVRAEYPKTAERLDKLEQFALEQEQQGKEAEVVTISFGAPTRKQAETFWSTPKSSKSSAGVMVTVALGPNSDWYAPTVVAPEGAKLLGVKHTPGMHGGYFCIEVAIPQD